jgi:hypothetical protein
MGGVRLAMLRIAVLACALACALHAAAQTLPRGHGPQRGHGGPQTGEMPAPNVLEHTLEELREDLKLRPQQQPAWDAYVEKVRTLAADVERERRRASAPVEAAALARIDRAVDAARNRYTALEDIAVAARALYATLSPEQKAVADQRLWAPVNAATPALPYVIERRP